MFHAQDKLNLIRISFRAQYLLYFSSKGLFREGRWDDLVQQFRRENFALHQLNAQSILEVTLQCGLASLKTPYPSIYQKEYHSNACFSLSTI